MPELTKPVPSAFLTYDGLAVIIEDRFSKLSAQAAFGVLQEVQDKKVCFVPTFASLTNPAKAWDDLLKGKDVTPFFRYNNIQLTPEEEAALSVLEALKVKIKGVGPAYPWLDESQTFPEYSFNAKYVNKNGYQITIPAARKIWERAAKLWRDRPGQDGPAISVFIGGRDTYLRANSVKIGCQTVPRAEVEYVARHLGFDVPE